MYTFSCYFSYCFASNKWGGYLQYFPRKMWITNKLQTLTLFFNWLPSSCMQNMSLLPCQYPISGTAESSGCSRVLAGAIWAPSVISSMCQIGRLLHIESNISYRSTEFPKGQREYTSFHNFWYTHLYFSTSQKVSW